MEGVKSGVLRDSCPGSPISATTSGSQAQSEDAEPVSNMSLPPL